MTEAIRKTYTIRRRFRDFSCLLGQLAREQEELRFEAKRVVRRAYHLLCNFLSNSMLAQRDLWVPRHFPGTAVCSTAERNNPH